MSFFSGVLNVGKGIVKTASSAAADVGLPGAKAANALLFPGSSSPAPSTASATGSAANPAIAIFQGFAKIANAAHLDRAAATAGNAAATLGRVAPTVPDSPIPPATPEPQTPLEAVKTVGKAFVNQVTTIANKIGDSAAAGAADRFAATPQVQNTKTLVVVGGVALGLLTLTTLVVVLARSR